MAKAEPIEVQLIQLGALRKATDIKSRDAEIAKAIANKSSLIAAKGADLARELQVADMSDALHKAFDRFMQKPAATDKGCYAKTAIAKALYEMGINDLDVFLRGIHHTQPEPVWGGSQDTAAELRGICALGLVRANYHDVMNELAELVVDPDPNARANAVRAIGYSENDLVGTPMLRMKLLSGDAHPEVTVEAFAALMKLAPAKSIDFVARFLEKPDPEMREMALLALGQSRQPAGFDLLQSMYEREVMVQKRREFLQPIALTRLPAAHEFLLHVILDEPRDLAIGVIEALKPFRSDSTLRAKIEKAVEDRDEPAIREAFERVMNEA
jgi:HEAT repeat protein